MGVLALLALNIRDLIFLECLMGTSDMNSTPPATMTSYAPAAIKPIPKKKKQNWILSIVKCLGNKKGKLELIYIFFLRLLRITSKVNPDIGLRKLCNILIDFFAWCRQSF